VATNAGWQTGDEPVPPPIDSWAPGSLPVRIPGPPMAAQQPALTAQPTSEAASATARAAVKVAAQAKVKATATAASRVTKEDTGRPSSNPDRFRPRPPSGMFVLSRKFQADSTCRP
jgi:hypothetical protein